MCHIHSIYEMGAVSHYYVFVSILLLITFMRNILFVLSQMEIINVLHLQLHIALRSTIVLQLQNNTGVITYEEGTKNICS